MATIVLAMPAAMAATAQGAQSYGELTRFGKLGTKAGQFTTGNAGVVGVDPTDNSVYVGDEPKGNGESTATYRIQKFSATGTQMASVEFKVSAASSEGGNPAGLEGIAVDPALKRVYALVVYEREEEEGTKREKENKAIEKENEKLEKEGKQPLELIKPRIDPEELAAGTLYAFSTKETGKELKPAENEGKELSEGVFASIATLHAQSEVTGKPSESALLEPSGIAVDPSTKDVVILGTEDPGEEERRSAAQRVSSAGALGARWVDTTNCFEGEGSEACEEAGAGSIPNSLALTQTGRVLVSLSGSEIWEIPKTFVPGQLPKPVLQPDLLQNIFEFPGNPVPSQGGGLAYVHDPEAEGETEGTLYATGAIKTTARLPGVVAFKLGESGGNLAISELGWTGGQSQAQNPDEPCAIGVFSAPAVAAGKKRAIFVYDPGKQLAPPANPHVLAFGPNPPSSSCPSATADGPKATLNGQEVGTIASPAHVGDKVALSSNVTQGNALSADWNFGDGTTGSEPKYQYQTTRIEHPFTKSGTFVVEETIHTDNLAEPTIVKKANVVVAAAKPIAQFSGPSAVTAGQTAAFDAKGSSDPNGSKIVEYKWKFGDGAETTTTSPSVSHQYTATGLKTVSLQVADELKLTSDAITHPITVNAAGGGGGESGGGGGGESSGGGGGDTGGGGTTGGGTTGGGSTGAATTGVQGSHTVKVAPEAKLASTSLAVSPSGGVVVKVTCPAGATNCAGTVTLRTLGAVSAQAGKKAVLTLASGSFTVGGGSSKSLTLHLSAKARKLLARSHVLRVRATIQAHDTTGATHTTLITVTLKPAKKAAHH